MEQFTGHLRDAETGLDFMQARYYSNASGRFTSPDEWAGGIVDAYSGGAVGSPGPLPYADITDPQTINKYAYVRNNPLRYVDPDGHDLSEAFDYVVGIGRGIAASVSGGVIGAPKSSDSMASRLGQGFGTTIEGVVGVGVMDLGIGGGIVTSPTGVGIAAGSRSSGSRGGNVGGCRKECCRHCNDADAEAERTDQERMGG